MSPCFMPMSQAKKVGACAYLTRLLSTALMVVFGRAEASWPLVVASLLIAGGAALASRQLFTAG
jgi:hypothetical protein